MQSPRVYQVMPDDDINQLLRVVTDSPGEQIRIVLPAGSGLLRHDVNLRLLLAYSARVGANLGIVTEDRATIENAARWGIPTYDSPEGPAREPAKAPQKTYTTDKPHESQRAGTTAWSRRVAVIFIAAAALLALRFMLHPKVHITIAARFEVWHHSQTVVVPIERQDAVLLQPIEVSGVASLVPSGGVRVGVSSAQGVVVFLNSGEQSVRIPKGTLLSTESGQQFALDHDVVVPGREVTFFLDVPVGMQSGRAEGRASALHPGSEGNVGADRIRAIEGDWPGLTVRNVDAFVGGADGVLPAVTAADLIRVREQALADFDRNLSQMLGEWAQRHPHLQLVEVDTSQREVLGPDVTLGEAREVVQAEARAVVYSYWVDPTDFAEIVEVGIPERVPIGYTWERTMGFDLHVEGYDSNHRQLILTALVPVRPTIDGSRLAQAVAGMSVDEALDVLGRQPGVMAAQILPEAVERLPTWAPWIRINVVSDGEVP